MKRKGSRACWRIGTEATAAVPFEGAEAVIERLRRGPGEAARKEMAVTPDGPPPSRWTLRAIRATFEEVAHYTLSGVWRWLRERVGVRLRSAQVQQYSPDPEYSKKEKRLKRCLRKTAREPEHVVTVFLDEMGYSIWPDPAADWTAGPPHAPPEAARQKANNGLWRIVGALDASSGQVTYLDNYIVGRQKIIEMYRRLADTYPAADIIYVVQDNWSIHRHPDVLEALADYPRIKPLWLPTYAPWLNPIEKLWRWLKEDILKLHRLAGNWPTLRKRVHDFLAQFENGSEELLQYTGLAGDGALARALAPP